MHAVTQQRGSKLYSVDTKLLAQLHASATAVAAATSAAAAAKSCSGMINLDGNSSSSSSSRNSGTVVIAVQESVLMKMMVPPEGWQSTVDNGVKLISYDDKCCILHSVQFEYVNPMQCTYQCASAVVVCCTALNVKHNKPQTLLAVARQMSNSPNPCAF
jgi:hypothetical protein